MSAGVGKQNAPAIDSGSKLQNVFAFDPSQVVIKLIHTSILPLRTAIVGIAVESRVAREGEGRDGRDIRLLKSLQPGDSSLPIDLNALSLKIGSRTVIPTQM